MKRLYKATKLAAKAAFAKNNQERYDALHELMESIVGVFGFHLYNRGLICFRDPEFLENWRKYPEAKQNVVHPRKLNLYYLAKSVRDLGGDTMEAGCWHGASTILIMLAAQTPGATHHIFDSFEGLSEPEVIDTVQNDKATQWKKHDLSTTEEILRRNIDGHGTYKVYKGWIPERFTEVADKKFSFAHIDVDLYQPTYDTLSFFYERMLPGGIIICDDYGYDTCPGAYKACNDFMTGKRETVIHLTSGQGMIIKR